MGFHSAFKGLTRTYQQWRTDTRANGVLPHRPITAGWWRGMLWEFSTSDK